MRFLANGRIRHSDARINGWKLVLAGAGPGLQNQLCGTLCRGWVRLPLASANNIQINSELVAGTTALMPGLQQKLRCCSPVPAITSRGDMVSAIYLLEGECENRLGVGEQKGRWLVTNLKRWFALSTLIGVPLIFVGIAVGQRTQSRFDPYLTSTPRTMDLAVLAASR